MQSSEGAGAWGAAQPGGSSALQGCSGQCSGAQRGCHGGTVGMQPESSMDAAGGSGNVVQCSLGAAGMQRDRAAPAPLLREPREGGAGDAAGHSAGAGRALQVRVCSTNATGRSDPANLQEVQWGKQPVQMDGVRQGGAVGLGVQHRHSWMQWGHSGDAVGPWQQAGVLQWGSIGMQGAHQGLDIQRRHWGVQWDPGSALSGGLGGKVLQEMQCSTR